MNEEIIELKADAEELQRQYEADPTGESAAACLNGLIGLLCGDIDTPCLDKETVMFFYEIFYGIYRKNPDNTAIAACYAKGIDILYDAYEGEYNDDYEYGMKREQLQFFMEKLRVLYEENPNSGEVAEIYVHRLYFDKIGSDVQKNEAMLEKIRSLYLNNQNNDTVIGYYADAIQNMFTFMCLTKRKRGFCLTKKRF